jgi:transcriptional regulator with XRE-family HTH domain
MIAHYETHAIQPSLDKIEAIAKALGVQPSILLSSDSPNTDEVDPSLFDVTGHDNQPLLAAFGSA